MYHYDMYVKVAYDNFDNKRIYDDVGDYPRRRQSRGLGFSSVCLFVCFPHDISTRDKRITLKINTYLRP